jgi:hypothetical protein
MLSIVPDDFLSSFESSEPMSIGRGFQKWQRSVHIVASP